MPPGRAFAIALLTGLTAIVAHGARADDDDRSMGSPDAPVVVVEYLSPTSPHSARFAEQEFPALKVKYIDTGKVRFVVREFPIHPTFDAPAFLLARCVPNDRYFDVINRVMAGQKEYFGHAIVMAKNADELITDAYRKTLFMVARDIAGMDEKAAIACMSNGDSIRELDARATSETQAIDVNAVPTFFVDGVRIEQPEKVVMSNVLLFPAIERAILAKTKG